VHGGRVTGADTATELLGQLIPGYCDLANDDAGHDDALWRRHESAVATAGELQETVLAAAAENGDFDAATAGEEVLTALPTAKTTPYTGRAWRQAVPLVLIDTDYQPFTARPRPMGRIITYGPRRNTTTWTRSPRREWSSSWSWAAPDGAQLREGRNRRSRREHLE
jgi:hypothetical protein